MNEIELLRNQLAAERRRVRAAACACAAAHAAPPAPLGGAALGGAALGSATLETFRAACTEYLECVLGWFDQRAERLAGHDPRLTAGESGRGAFARLLAGRPAREGWRSVTEFIEGPWETRHGAIEAWLAANPRITDWRSIAGIDADTMYQERALYARVQAALPPGVKLA